MRAAGRVRVWKRRALPGALLAAVLSGPAARVLGQYPGEEEPTPPADYGDESLWEEEERSSWGEWRDPVRRQPPEIPPARPLPYYPPAPPTVAPPSTASSSPPDFTGSAAGLLELPVGQTATVLTRDCLEATTRDPQTAEVVARQADRVLVRARFPGRTLLEVRGVDHHEVYLLQVH